MPFGTEKLDWFGYPMVKNLEDAITRFNTTQSTNVTYRHTDRHTHTA